MQQLLAVAVGWRVNIRLRPRVGEHVAAGTTLAWLWPTGPGGSIPEPEDCASALARAVRIGVERTLEQDPGLGLRQLIDCACKALSPAVNDPYTAIQAIECLSVLFAALVARPLGDLVMRGRASTVVVAVPGWSLAEHLSLGVGLIRRYGSSEPTVACALLRLLCTVSAAADNDPVRLSVIENEASLIVAGAEREVAEPADLAVVHGAMDVLGDVLAVGRAAGTR